MMPTSRYLGCLSTFSRWQYRRANCTQWHSYVGDLLQVQTVIKREVQLLMTREERSFGRMVSSIWYEASDLELWGDQGWIRSPPFALKYHPVLTVLEFDTPDVSLVYVVRTWTTQTFNIGTWYSSILWRWPSSGRMHPSDGRRDLQ